MSAVRLVYAGGEYDRTKDLWTGEVAVEGVDLTYLRLSAAEVFWRMLRHREFDACEMSLSAYVLLMSRGDSSLVGLPVFPVRTFRHASIYVRRGAGISGPEELRGRRVGVPQFHMTAALFARGLLQDEWGVRTEDIEWVRGGLSTPDIPERVRLDLPPTIHLEEAPAGRTLEELSSSGELDALITPFVPFSSGGRPVVKRLFRSPRRAARDYYRRTGIFPIMHLVVIDRATYERHPWIAPNLGRAFESARLRWLQGLREAAPTVGLPFFEDFLEEITDDFGHDFWPYGVERNRSSLDAALRYSFEQGLAGRRLSVEDLFEEPILDAFGGM